MRDTLSTGSVENDSMLSYRPLHMDDEYVTPELRSNHNGREHQLWNTWQLSEKISYSRP